MSPRIAGRWDVQETWCNRYSVAQVRHITLGRATRAFANHFFSRLRFVGLGSPNKNKYHSSADYFLILTTHSTSYRADESWMREQKGVGELSVCMGTSVGTRMFMRIKVRSLPFWVTGTYVEAIPFHFSSFNFFNWIYLFFLIIFKYIIISM